MKADLYKTISLGMIAVLNLFFAASLHAGPLSVGDDTSSQPPIEEIQNTFSKGPLKIKNVKAASAASFTPPNIFLAIKKNKDAAIK